MSANAPKVSGARGASAPPARAASTVPSRMAWNAWPIAIAPEAHEFELPTAGPVIPRSSATLLAPAPPKTASASVGATPRTPRVVGVGIFRGDVRIGRPLDWSIRSADYTAEQRFISYQSPRQFIFSIYERVDPVDDTWSDVLKRYPWASTIGNHDVGGKAYEQHNQVPNSLKVPDFYPGGNTTANSGGDYWYMYKGVLFIDINSNAYAAGSDAAHVNYVRDVINRYGDDAKWTTLVYHHSIYSPADHANDDDNQQRRGDFTKAFSDLGVDLVLQGHDHSYSRSYALKGTELGQAPVKADPNEQPGQQTVGFTVTVVWELM